MILNGVISIDKCLFVNFLKHFRWLGWVACWEELVRKVMGEGLDVMIEFEFDLVILRLGSRIIRGNLWPICGRCVLCC